MRSADGCAGCGRGLLWAVAWAGPTGAVLPRSIARWLRWAGVGKIDCRHNRKALQSDKTAPNLLGGVHAQWGPCDLRGPDLGFPEAARTADLLGFLGRAVYPERDTEQCRAGLF